MELTDLAARHELPGAAVERLRLVLDALGREPDPQTTVPPPDWVDVHVADSLVALDVPALRAAARIVDVGAGAGFPGLPLAIASSSAKVVLVESARRKAALIERVVEAAGIGNARVVNARVEDWARAEGAAAYEVVCARALGPLALVLEYAAPLLAIGGTVVAWKGRRDDAEEDDAATAAAELGLELQEVRPVQPFPRSRDRHLHLYRKSRVTPERFPRRAGMAAKRPLG